MLLDKETITFKIDHHVFLLLCVEHMNIQITVKDYTYFQLQEMLIKQTYMTLY